MKIAPATIAAAGLLALVVAYNCELIVHPMHYRSIVAPAPLAVVIPYMVGARGITIVLAWVAAFLLWNPALLAGGSHTPDRSLWLWGMCALLAASHGYLAFRYGGWHRDFRIVWIIASLGLGATSIALLLRAQRQPSYRAALTAQTLLWLWPATVAAPAMALG